MFKHLQRVWVWLRDGVSPKNQELEEFRAHLKTYLTKLGYLKPDSFLCKERLVRQIEFLKQHGYKPDYTGAVFIAGCNYAHGKLKYQRQHQILSFSDTLTDVFVHRHDLGTMERKDVISRSMETVGLTFDPKLYRDLSRAVVNLLS